MKTITVELTTEMWDALAGLVDGEMLKLEITERHLRTGTPDEVRDSITRRHGALQAFRGSLGARP